MGEYNLSPFPGQPCTFAGMTSKNVQADLKTAATLQWHSCIP